MTVKKINFLSYVQERTVVVVKVAQSCQTLRPHGLYSPWSSPGQNSGVGSHSLLQGIFLTQGLNQRLLNWQGDSLALSHLGSPTYFPLLFSPSVVSNSLWPHELQHTMLIYPSLSLGVCSNSCPLSWWCHPTISFFVVPFSSCLQFFPASCSFPIIRVFSSESAPRIRQSKY